MSNIQLKTVCFLILTFILLFHKINCLSYKIGNPTNPYIQTGEATLFTSTLPLSTTTFYTITYGWPMSTNIL